VTAALDKTTSIILCWLPADLTQMNGEPRGYNIKYKELYADAQDNFYSVGYNAMGIQCTTLTDLQLGSDYELSVSCYNMAGTGPFSDALTVSIPEGIPTLPPTNVTAVALSSSSVEVNFKLPPYTARRSSLRYKVMAQRLSNNALSEDRAATSDAVQHGIVRRSALLQEDSVIERIGNAVGKTTETVLIDQLQKFALYRISVVCFNDAGQGPSSRHVDVQTLDDG
jgi:Fibronectin type III domain